MPTPSQQDYLNASVSQVIQGTLNRVEQVEVDGHMYARRWMSPRRLGSASRNVEQRVWIRAAEQALAPRLLMWDDAKNVCISDWVASSSETVPFERIVETLREFHTLELRMIDPTPAFMELVSHYKEPSVHQSLFERIIQLENTLSLSQLPRVLSHNDLGSNNLLYSNHRVWLIDFEYAGINHPWIDIATLWIDRHEEHSLEGIGQMYAEVAQFELNTLEIETLKAAAELCSLLGMAWAEHSEPSWREKFTRALSQLA